MAEKRMFAKTIIDSDAFLDMPLSSQALYFHLSMRADDEGFVNNPKKIVRMICAAQDDLNVLILRNFVIPFDSGIIVIKHWKMNNYLRSDRFKPTVYTRERSMLILNKNGAYSLNKNNVGIPNDNHISTDGQPSIDQSSLDKYRLDDDIGDSDLKKDDDDDDGAEAHNLLINFFNKGLIFENEINMFSSMLREYITRYQKELVINETKHMLEHMKSKKITNRLAYLKKSLETNLKSNVTHEEIYPTYDDDITDDELKEMNDFLREYE